MSSSPTDQLVEVDDAEDGHLGLRGDDPRVAQAARRLGRGRRDDRRRDDRQGRRRDPVAGERPAGADHRRAGRERPGRRADRRDRRGREAGRGASGGGDGGPRTADRGAGGRRPHTADRRGQPARPLELRLAGRAPDRRQAQRRPGAGRGHRHRRPRAQEGRARLRRVRTAAKAGRSPPRCCTPNRRTSPTSRSQSLLRPSNEQPAPSSLLGPGANRCPPCARRSPSTCWTAGGRRRTARRSSRSTCRGSRRGARSSRSR